MASSTKGKRFLVLYFSCFRLERYGYLTSEVVVLCSFSRNALRVLALTPAALSAGLTLDMTISEARAMYPQVQLEMWCKEEEARDWATLLEVFRSYSDCIQRGRDWDLVLEVSGTAHLFGGEERLVQRVNDRAAALGHLCQVALADDPRLASVWARSGAGGVLPVGQGARYLAPLPFVALGPSERLRSAIRALDIQSIGEWANLDPASVAGRYGEEGVYLHRVARGQSAWSHSRLSWPQAEVSERVELPEPTRTWAPIEWALRGALERLVVVLAQREQRVAQLRVHLISETVESTIVRVRYGRPSSDIEVLVRFCRHRMERVRLLAPVVACLVEVERAAPESAEQQDLLDRRQVGTALPEVIARLVDGLGERAVFQAVESDSWRPEKAWQTLLFGEESPRAPALKKPDPVALQQGQLFLTPSPRPGVLLERPFPIKVRERTGRPEQVKWEERWWSVVRLEGPEYLCVEWWKEDGGIRRKYWTIDFGGRIGWIFQDECANWALHGWFG